MLSFQSVPEGAIFTFSHLFWVSRAPIERSGLFLGPAAAEFAVEGRLAVDPKLHLAVTLREPFLEQVRSCGRGYGSGRTRRRQRVLEEKVPHREGTE